MNSDERTPENMLDQVIDGIRNEPIDPQALEQSRKRAWEQITRAAEESAGQHSDVGLSPIRSCADFQALLPAYQANTLSEARRLLVEDHTHECVACRRALHQLAEPRPVIAMPAARPVPAWRKYAIAASLLVTAGLAGWRAYETFGPAPAGSRAVVQSASGSVLRISNGMLQPVAVGAEINEGDTIRTSPGSHLMLKLHDGSMIEVNERAEFNVSLSRSDTTLKLDRGTVIVQAAKRKSGYLYVASADCRVAVTGTIFAVNRGVKGSRVSVVEGSVAVEQGGRQVTLRPGDQVSTDESMASVPIRQEIAWSQNFNEHLALLNAIADLKSKLDTIRLPELRYGSRLLELAPASTVVLASMPNAGQALSDVHRLFEEQIRLSPELQKWVKSESGSEDHSRQFIDLVRRFSEYIGQEIMIAIPAPVGSRPQSPVVLAEVHRPGFREFLNSELPKLSSEHSGSGAQIGVQIIEGQAPIRSRAAGELLIVLRNNHVIAGVDARSLEEVARNIDGTGTRAFAKGEFGGRLMSRFRSGTGILVGFDLQHIGPFEAKSEQARRDLLNLGADRVRYLLVEQKQLGADAQRSAELSFEGARSGIASWLGTPASIGGLSFVSPDAQLVAAGVTKRPDQLVDDLLALNSETAAFFEEARKHLRIDLKQDVAALLGGEVTFAIDGPLVPTPSWKVAIDVNNAAHLQQTIEKVVNAANLVAQLSGRQGYKLDSETVGGLTYHVVRVLDPSLVPELHYVYTAGYLLVAPNRGLLTKAMHSKQSGVMLTRTDRFRKLLPRDGHTNFSGIVYQNAGEWLGSVASALGSDQQRAAGEIASKVGPLLICAYGEQDRIEIVNKGSAWDIVMQSVLQPIFQLASQPAANRGTNQALKSYR